MFLLYVNSELLCNWIYSLYHKSVIKLLTFRHRLSNIKKPLTKISCKHVYNGLKYTYLHAITGENVAIENHRSFAFKVKTRVKRNTLTVISLWLHALFVFFYFYSFLLIQMFYFLLNVSTSRCIYFIIGSTKNTPSFKDQFLRTTLGDYTPMKTWWVQDSQLCVWISCYYEHLDTNKGHLVMT